MFTLTTPFTNTRFTYTAGPQGSTVDITVEAEGQINTRDWSLSLITEPSSQGVVVDRVEGASRNSSTGQWDITLPAGKVSHFNLGVALRRIGDRDVQEDTITLKLVANGEVVDTAQLPVHG